MRRVFLIFLLLLGGSVAANAQTEPNYTVFFISRQLIDDDINLETEFVVSNSGATAQSETTAELRILGETNILTTGIVPPLSNGETFSLLMIFPINSIEVRPDAINVFELTLRSSTNEFNEVRRLAEFTIPEADIQIGIPPAATSQPDIETNNTSENNTLLETRQSIEDWLNNILPIEVDLTKRTHILIACAALAVITILIWLFTVIVRQIFVRPPKFPANPPPYTGMAYLNPDSLPGRRQMWQPIAQHGSVFADETEGNLQARKLLLGTDEGRYSGWQVIGIRASQYDTYGRVSRSQVILGKRHQQRLTNTINKAITLPPNTVRQRVRPVANELARQLNRKIKNKGAGLPIALDIKFKGIHGEVRILFELYQYQLGAWRRLDSWQPEMTVSGRSIYEFYTYTVFGMQENESMRSFRRRLRAELTELLVEMVRCTPPRTQPIQPVTPPQFQRPVSVTPPTQQNIQQVMPDGVSTTTSSMRPVPPPNENDDTKTDEGMSEDTVTRQPPSEY